ncbi:MAG: MFS transporter [Dehalococcoidia bacterium]
MPRGAGYRALLSFRSYRLYFASSTLGAFASAVQFLAQGWLMVEIGPAAWTLTVFLVVRIGVKSLLAVPAGLLADRIPRSTLYAWMRVASGVASIVTALALVSPAPLAVAIAGAVIAAAAHAIDLPAHRALMGQVQPDEYLERGLAFGTGGFHIASLLAPIAALPLAAAFGAPLPLVLSGAMFAASAVPAFLIPPTRCARDSSRATHDVSAALRFLAQTPIVVALSLAITLPSVIDKAVVVMLPSHSGDQHAQTMGFVLAAPELGAIAIGFLLAAVRWQFAPWITLVSAAAYATGIATASFAGVAVGIEAIAVALFLAGCAKTTLITSALAGLQRHVPDHMRGRIMTI